jgi:hypothetical protein
MQFIGSKLKPKLYLRILIHHTQSSNSSKVPRILFSSEKEKRQRKRYAYNIQTYTTLTWNLMLNTPFKLDAVKENPFVILTRFWCRVGQMWWRFSLRKNKEAIAILCLEVGLVFVKKNKETLAILCLEVASVFVKKNKEPLSILCLEVVASW